MKRILIVVVDTYDGSYPDPGALVDQTHDVLTAKGRGLHVVDLAVTEVTDIVGRYVELDAARDARIAAEGDPDSAYQWAVRDEATADFNEEALDLLGQLVPAEARS